MKEVTMRELINDLKGKSIRVQSFDIYGMQFSFDKAQIDYDDDFEILYICAGNYNTGMGSVGIRIDDIVDVIRLEDDGSYTLQFNQYIADVNIEIEK